MNLIWLVGGASCLRGPLLPAAETSIAEKVKTDVAAAFREATDRLDHSTALIPFLQWWRLAEMRLAWEAMDAGLARQLATVPTGAESAAISDAGRHALLLALQAERNGNYALAVELLERAAEALPTATDPCLRGMIAERLGRNCLVVARFTQANVAFREAAKHYREAGNERALARLWIARSGSSTQSIEDRLAGPLEARAVFEAEGDDAQLAEALLVSGYEAFSDSLVSEEAFREALTLARKTGNREAALFARLGLAEVLLFSGGVAEARALMAALVEEVSPRAPAPLRAAVSRVSGYTAAFTDDPRMHEAGLRELEASAALFGDLGDEESLQFVRLCKGELLLQMDRSAAAVEALQPAVRWMRDHDSRFLLEALSLLELALVQSGAMEEAYYTLVEYVDVREAQFEAGMAAELAALSDRHLSTLREVQLENLRATEALQKAELTAQSQRVDLLEARQAQEAATRRLILAGLGLSLGVSLLFGYLYRLKRRAERRVRQLNGQLLIDKEKREAQWLQLQEQNLQLAQANGRFKEIDEERKRVLGIAAHEMSNPLSAVDSTFETLGRALGDERVLTSPRPQHELIEIGRESLRSLSALRDRILAARSDETLVERLQLRPLELRAVLRQVVVLNELHATRKGIVVHLEGSRLPAVLADAQACREVFDNLLSNALKFSAPESQVRIVPRVVEGDRVEVRIEDQGPGVPAADRDRIFLPFGKSSHRPTGGESATGLGLATVKELVSGMRGLVWVEDVVGGGAAFIVTLPVAGSGLISFAEDLPSEAMRKKDCPAPAHL
jgi:signal transduction histidine kinase